LAREFEALLPLVRWVNGALGLDAGSKLARSGSVRVPSPVPATLTR
jgi:hypothetical protein